MNFRFWWTRTSSTSSGWLAKRIRFGPKRAETRLPYSRAQRDSEPSRSALNSFRLPKRPFGGRGGRAPRGFGNGERRTEGIHGDPPSTYVLGISAPATGRRFRIRHIW